MFPKMPKLGLAHLDRVGMHTNNAAGNYRHKPSEHPKSPQTNTRNTIKYEFELGREDNRGNKIKIYAKYKRIQTIAFKNKTKNRTHSRVALLFPTATPHFFNFFISSGT